MMVVRSEVLDLVGVALLVEVASLYSLCYVFTYLWLDYFVVHHCLSLIVCFDFCCEFPTNVISAFGLLGCKIPCVLGRKA